MFSTCRDTIQLTSHLPGAPHRLKANVPTLIPRVDMALLFPIQKEEHLIALEESCIMHPHNSFLATMQQKGTVFGIGAGVLTPSAITALTSVFTSEKQDDPIQHV